MKVTEAKYGRKFRLAEYESEEIVLTAVVEEDDEASAVLADLKAQVEAAHAGEEVEEDKPKKKSGKKASKKDEDEAEEGEDNEEESEEEKDSEEDADEEESEESEEEVDEEESEEEESPKAKKKPAAAKGKKSFKSKASVYDRESELHKKLVGEVLDEKFPKWRKDKKLAAKAKAVSAKMESNAFLDSEGDIVPAFVTKFVKLMKAK